ncbi:MAG TPA: decarboxylating 6-phosphogluconate dehydrogenase [Steroidobacteraceae bacterium]|nr:decarboxylating 6-phosphogluconate dehydrogenase [Steroidobacteraceae bacterium]
MQLGMIGLGRMGSNMVRRLTRAGHHCTVFDHDQEAVRRLAAEGATGASSATDLLSRLPAPRVLWLMIPAAAVDALLQSLTPALQPGDILIDGGNSYYGDDRRRQQALASRGVRYLDVGTSGGVWGLERGYCLMIGGDTEAVHHIEPILSALAPGAASAAGTERAPGTAKAAGAAGADAPAAAGSASTATRGYLHVGPSGAGHFVKMVHNGVEYGLMAAYAEGFNLLHQAGAGPADGVISAETAPSHELVPREYHFKLDEIAELWRHGSVVASWLLDLVASALGQAPGLEHYAGNVSDSGEGRWTVQAAIDSGVPVPVLATALFARFSSRGQADFADRMLSAMRYGFGGHLEQPGKPTATPGGRAGASAKPGPGKAAG